MSTRLTSIDEANLVALGVRVKTLREERRMSQEQLAHASGLHRTVIGFIERAEREIGVSKLWRLAGALDVSVSALVDERAN